MKMFPVIETPVYITESITLEPGDIILTETPSGVGHASQPPQWMKVRDVVEIKNTGLGRNPIRDEAHRQAPS